MTDKKTYDIHTEKITVEPFDDVSEHREEERKYFTTENNDTIYKRLRKETDLFYLPYLGVCVGYGEGDVCIEECIKDDSEIFKFYIIDRFAKFDYQEFNNIEDVINKLIEYYTNYKMVSNSKKVKSIFEEVLNLPKHKKLVLEKEHK